MTLLRSRVWSGRPDAGLELGELGAQRLLGVAALGHLAHDRGNPDDLAGLVAQQGHAELDRQPMPVRWVAGTLNSVSP